jgi:SAM-dependent methyltransferase
VSVEPWSPEAFEARYRTEGDPWDFAHSAFEQARYDDLMQCLPRAHYEHAYEPGCAVGALTERLARRCARVDAVDVSPTAAEWARDRCAGLPGVRVCVGSVEDDPPSDLDLVVFAEIGYYFDTTRLGEIVDRLAGAVVPGGELLACHWTGSSEDHRLPGGVVHEVLAARLRDAWDHIGHAVRTDYVVDVWCRR